jgi:prepilin-type N-terminal cleavage/methylation domain-containing protein
MKHKMRTTGFTIVELLIVIVVIAILATITIVSYQGVTSSAVLTNAKLDVSNIAKQMELYRTDNGAYPPIIAAAGVNTPGLETVLRSAGLYNATRNPNAAKAFVFCTSNSTQDYIVIAEYPVFKTVGGAANTGLLGREIAYASSSITGTKTYSTDLTTNLRSQNLCTSVGGSAYSNSNNARWSFDVPVSGG